MMNIDPADVDKVADFVVVATYKVTADAQTQYFFSLSDTGVQPWDGNLSTLPALKKGVTLQAQTNLYMYNGSFATGEHDIYMGYRLSDGTLVYNVNPVHISVTADN